MPDPVLDPVGITYLAPHSGCPKRSGEDCVRSCLRAVPAGNAVVSTHSPAFLTLRDTNVLNPRLDEADETRTDAMKVIHNTCRPALRAVRCLPGSGFATAPSGSVQLRLDPACAWICCFLHCEGDRVGGEGRAIADGRGGKGRAWSWMCWEGNGAVVRVRCPVAEVGRGWEVWTACEKGVRYAVTARSSVVICCHRAWRKQRGGGSGVG